MEHPLDESVWRRGWQDTKKGWKHPLFLVLEVLVSPAAGLIASNAWVSVLVVFVGIVSIWIGATGIAPIKQRNEARNELLKKPTPIPIPNRTELIRALSEVSNAAYNCLSSNSIAAILAETRHINADKVRAESVQARKQFEEAREKVERESLVAGGGGRGGGRFGGIMLEVQKFVSVLRRDVYQSFGGKHPDIDVPKRKLQYDILLDGTILRIDEISQSTSHKEDSQT